MKHVCDACSEIIFSFGYPAHKLCDAVTTSFFNGLFMCYNQSVLDVDKDITPALRYLENLEILISTEISQTDIIILPNLDYAYIDGWSAEICWCELLKDEFPDSYDNDGDGYEEEFNDV